MKTTRLLPFFACAALSSAFLLALQPAAHAATYPDFKYQLTINVSSLVNDPDGPFSLDLQLVQGSGNVSNTVTLSNFTFTGGSATGTPDYTNGGETGSISSSVVLTNSSSDNEFAEAFSAGVTQITFQVDQTPNSEVVKSGTPIPEQFNVAILDGGLNNIATTDPSSGNALVSTDFDSRDTDASVKTFSSISPDGGVTAAVVAPEPSANALLAGGLAALAFIAVLRRKSGSIS